MDFTKKAQRYQRLKVQLQELLVKTDHLPSKMATINAVLHHKMDNFFWTGFYLLHNGKLLVGPYQGSLACQELAKDKGVCWAAVNRNETVIVPNVHDFPEHIACDGRSQSEICVPVRTKSGEIIAVMDIDSNILNNFDEVDARSLEEIVALLM
jgi:L-methionine (R)-S-oxide reductase